LGVNIKKFKTLPIALILLVLVLVIFPGPPASGAQVVVAPIVEKMARAFQGMRSLKAALNQQKTYGQLGISDPVEHGSLFIKRKGERDIQVRIEISKPAQRVITVKDNQFTVFQPNIKQAIEGSVNKTLASNQSGAGFFSLFFGGMSQISKDYQIATAGDESVNGRRTTHLVLSPNPGRRGLYRQVDMWVDTALWVPTQERFVEANQDVTVLNLLDIQINLDLPDHLFTQKLPRDIQRVKS
jgi:outer membrane lipoprotein-sorting protein